MDLLGKVAIVAIVLIVIFSSSLLVYNYAIKSNKSLTASQAQQIVIEDLHQTHPNASIIVTNVTPSTLSQGSWYVYASIVYNATRPCPTVYLDQYDYPATGLVPTVANLYTQHCIIFGLAGTGLPYYTYLITSPEIAIAKSYNSSYPSLVRYVSAFGYYNTNVYAKRYAVLNHTTMPANVTFYNAWLINYTAAYAPYSEYVVMNSTGMILYNYSVSR